MTRPVSRSVPRRITQPELPKATVAKPTQRPAKQADSFVPASGSVPPPPPTRPAASPLVGLKFTDTSPGDQGRIKDLQDTLVRLGHLSPDIVQDPGYGQRFGPKTLAALNDFQAANGLPPTRTIDEATAAAFANPRPAPTGLDRLAGLSPGATAPADRGTIKELQDALIQLGYLPTDIVKDGGYGKRFGPRTQAAVEQLQRENGVPGTGTVDAATVAAMKSPRPRPEGVASGLASQFRDQLGLVRSPLQHLPDGSTRQDFDAGYILVDAERTVHVCRTDGSDLVPPHTLGTVASVEEGNAHFVTQWGPTPYNSGAVPYGYNDCGPTSGLIALSALGLAPHPSPDGASQAIDGVRDACLGYDSTASTRMGFGTLATGLEAAGAKTEVLSPASRANLDTALDAGSPVIIGGNPWAAWGSEQNAAGNYLNHRDPGGHFVCLLGRTPEGGYIVADPLVKGGTLAITAAQLDTFMSTGGFGAMAVSPP